MQRYDDLGAIVLCGGRSRRMGRPKAWLPFGEGEVLLQRVVRLVREAVGPVVVVAAPDQEVPPLPSEAIVVRDPVADRGPLQGLAAGLAALADSAEFAFAVATDSPFLAPAWITFLRSMIGGADLAIPFVGGYHQPLAALYRIKPCAEAIGRLLAEDRLRPVFLAESVATVELGEEALRRVDPNLGTLRNLNDPVAYREALRDADPGDPTR